MTQKPKKLVHNVTTGQQEYVELNAAEIAELDQMQAKFEAERIKAEKEAQEKADAKLAAQAKLQGLGLTGAEIAAITEQVIKWQQRNIATCSPT